MLIFDLDGTVIDSSHRKATRPDGTLDLDHWIENCTPEKIAQDRLLPLADFMRIVYRIGRQPVVVCTARVMGTADYDFLDNNGLHVDEILSRPIGNRMRDGTLKEMLLRGYATHRCQTWQEFTRNASMFDDCDDVITTLSRAGVAIYNAKFINEELGL